jgi:hypothetical protein
MGHHHELALTIILVVTIGAFFAGLLWRLYRGRRE